ncbi:MAG: nucleotidyl transferase AbiEii/AbiGii toxin family protein [Ilumatobacteraceae bacterium]
MSGLTDFQVEVTQLFFSLPASTGFLLAGGGALLASGLTTRPTQDLDFFGGPTHADIGAARDQFEAAVAQRGWRCERVQDSETFVRLRLSGDDQVIVDLAIDVPAGRPLAITIAGPTFDPEELAGRKVAALFGRAEARDFADVYALAQRFDRSVLIERAAEIDLGFDRRVLAEMMRTIDRFDDDELPVEPSDVAATRAFFEHWADELSRPSD